MHLPLFKHMGFDRIGNGRLGSTCAMNFTAEDSPDRVDRSLPGNGREAPCPAPGSRVSTWDRIGRHIGAFGTAFALHLVAVWALYAGLRAPAFERVVPVQMIAELVEAQVPVAAPMLTPVPPRAAPAKPSPPKPATSKLFPAPAKSPLRPAITQAAQAPVAAVAPSAVPATPGPAPWLAAAPGAPVGNPNPDTAAPTAQATAAVATDPAPSAIAAAPRAPAPLELPSSDALYLQNPKPRYPPISMRTGEQGTVMVQVQVTDMGMAKNVKLQTSSGFFRLDNAALEAVARWRFVPGKRAGVPQTMWFTVPITFGLQ
jgi:periplasmic protein TonB